MKDIKTFGMPIQSHVSVYKLSING